MTCVSEPTICYLFLITVLGSSVWGLHEFTIGFFLLSFVRTISMQPCLGMEYYGLFFMGYLIPCVSMWAYYGQYEDSLCFKEGSRAQPYPISREPAPNMPNILTLCSQFQPENHYYFPNSSSFYSIASQIFMGTYVSNAVCFSYPHPVNPIINESKKTHYRQFSGKTFWAVPISYGHLVPRPLMAISVVETAMAENTEGKPRFKWGVIGPEITEAQQEAIDQLPPKMSKRCQALMKQIICFSHEKGSLREVLDAWVNIMKPSRADWLAVLKELRIKDHPLYLQVAEISVLEESFEANLRDYTKIIHGYGKQNRIEDAEKTLSNMKSRGFICDQVTLTAMIDMYSKAGHLKLAEDTFEEIKLLGQQLDKRSYGSMIMAYIRAGMPDQGESLLLEMDAQEIYAGSEVYKALLRAYSMIGDTEGAQRVFNALQLAGISPDAKICALLINAYSVSGQSHKAHAAFENMRKAGLKPSDKCIALMLAAYEKENKLQMALKFLMGLEREGIMVGKEASETLAGWFRKLGVVEEVDMVLREFAANEANSGIPAS